MTSITDDVPEYRLFTSEQAAELVGGGEDGKITKATFDNLARSGCEHTRIGRKIRWTIAQIKAAVDHQATGSSAEEAKASASPTRDDRTAPPAQRGAVAPFRVRPGSRYASAH